MVFLCGMYVVCMLFVVFVCLVFCLCNSCVYFKWVCNVSRVIYVCSECFFMTCGGLCKRSLVCILGCVFSCVVCCVWVSLPFILYKCNVCCIFPCVCYVWNVSAVFI